jgi:hypothetical protein
MYWQNKTFSVAKYSHRRIKFVTLIPDTFTLIPDTGYLNLDT